MSIWHIYGGNRLTGSTRVQGAKNAVLPIMAASVLSGGETVLHNVPDLRDVTTTLRILQHLGCTAVRDGDTVRIDSRGMHCDFIPHALMRELRSSVIFLGAILARFGTARLSMPGGCELGPRPVNLHLDALRALGAEVTERGGDIICRAHALQGRRILLPFPSVGATENAMLAACAAAGETVICNAAREPEIADLQCYLRKLGADISGAGTSTVTVGGFRPRPFVEHTIMPDRIVAATILCAAAACGGEVELQDVDPAHFSTVLDSLSEAGCAIITTASAVRLTSDGQLTAPRPVVTQPYPGFPAAHGGLPAGKGHHGVHRKYLYQPLPSCRGIPASGRSRQHRGPCGVCHRRRAAHRRAAHGKRPARRRGHARGRALRRGRDRASRQRVY